jgi:putative oxygen-independent coproporphyrinogen III oxidase
MPLGLYISTPFCRTKCSYCNFASDVFSRAAFQSYVNRVCRDIEHASEAAGRMGGHLERQVDAIYLGGGTPTVLDVSQLKQLFVTIRQNFEVQAQAEVTVECAPGTLSAAMVAGLVSCGVNRVSLGVQSFVDEEARAVGRLHTRGVVLDDIARLRGAGISNMNVDLIAGLPHQTAESWEVSLSEAIGTGAPHLSVYMLEIDEDSRLGRELIAGGTRYHAHFVPDENLTADLYEAACARLEAAGIPQYEISNFARSGCESRHNLKYWTRQPYMGFGVDAHSMLRICAAGSVTATEFAAGRSDVRFATPDSLEMYLAGASWQRTPVSERAALEEAFFLGLRLTRGVDLKQIAGEFGEAAAGAFSETIAELVECGLLARENHSVRLTSRGRLLSNEVFARFIADPSGALVD